MCGVGLRGLYEGWLYLALNEESFSSAGDFIRIGIAKQNMSIDGSQPPCALVRAKLLVHHVSFSTETPHLLDHESLVCCTVSHHDEECKGEP